MLGFETVDVFTATRFAGNPLAVVFGGESLAPGQMQSIAAEFNLSETAFVLPPPRPDVTATVRIFTPRAELPFAGHPNVGTAFVVARRGGQHLVKKSKCLPKLIKSIIKHGKGGFSCLQIQES